MTLALSTRWSLFQPRGVSVRPRAEGAFKRFAVLRHPGHRFRPGCRLRFLYANRACPPLYGSWQCPLFTGTPTNARGHRSNVPDGTPCVRGPGVSPLRVEVQCTPCTFSSRCAASGFHIRRNFSPANDCQGPQSRYSLVLHARFRMAGAKSQSRSMAGFRQFRYGRTPETVAFKTQCDLGAGR